MSDGGEKTDAEEVSETKKGMAKSSQEQTHQKREEGASFCVLFPAFLVGERSPCEDEETGRKSRRSG